MSLTQTEATQLAAEAERGDLTALGRLLRQVADSVGSLFDATMTSTAAELNVLDGIASTATVAVAASGTSDGMDITVTVKDAAGATVEAVHVLDLYMSEDAAGIGITGDSYSGDLTAGTGAVLGAVTAAKHWKIATAATGIFVGTLVDTSTPADQYAVAKEPLGAGVVVSEVSGTNWGA